MKLYTENTRVSRILGKDKSPALDKLYITALITIIPSMNNMINSWAHDHDLTLTGGIQSHSTGHTHRPEKHLSYILNNAKYSQTPTKLIETNASTLLMKVTQETEPLHDSLAYIW